MTGRTDLVECDCVDVGAIDAEALVGRVPDEQALAAERVCLNLGGVCPVGEGSGSGESAGVRRPT
jgi:hypothetical protein